MKKILIMAALLAACGQQTNDADSQNHATADSVAETAPVGKQSEPLRILNAALAARTGCYKIPDADCSKEDAVVESAQAIWEKQVDKDFAEIDARADCIEKELGTKFDDASTAEILVARSSCGIIDPADAEEQLREQAERLSH